MKSLVLAICAVGLTITVLGTTAYAAALEVNIQFPFKAAGKDYPAGKYRIEAVLQTEELTIQDEGTGKKALLAFTTRLSAREGEAQVVFDKLGDQYYLSEIYLPGIDGFELRAATGKHTHVKVKTGK